MRNLNEREIETIKALLSTQKEYQYLLVGLEDLIVEELNDGAMGSIQFQVKGTQKLYKTISEAEFNDNDGVPVFLFLGLNSQGALFGLDVWKADFSIVKRWPPATDILVRRPK